MVRDVVKRLPEFASERPLRVVLDIVDNRTSSAPGRNYEIFLADLRGALANSFARYRILFFRDRADLARMQKREYGDDGGAPPGTAERRVEYTLTGKVLDLPAESGRSNVFLIEMSLVRLADGWLAWTQTIKFRFGG